MPLKLATIVFSILIIIAVLIPGSNIPDVKLIGIDKIVHVIMFATWAIGLKFDFPKFKPLLIFLAGLGFSLVTELLQLFTEDRKFDLSDMVADAAGLLFGMLVAKPVLKVVQQVLKR